jgi:hypothetical protein
MLNQKLESDPLRSKRISSIHERARHELARRVVDDVLHQRLAHDPEKWTPVFGRDHAQSHTTALRDAGVQLARDQSMIPKSGNRFSDKIMLNPKPSD